MCFVACLVKTTLTKNMTIFGRNVYLKKTKKHNKLKYNTK